MSANRPLNKLILRLILKRTNADNAASICTGNLVIITVNFGYCNLLLSPAIYCTDKNELDLTTIYFFRKLLSNGKEKNKFTIHETDICVLRRHYLPLQHRGNASNSWSWKIRSIPSPLTTLDTTTNNSKSICLSSTGLTVTINNFITNIFD